MKIHTSYFGKGRKIAKEHPDWVQIAICGKMTFPWGGLRYAKLAPKVGFFTEWKKSGDNAFYIRHYADEVLGGLDREAVLSDLAELAGGEDKTVVLMCYEKPGDFCHRHLAAEWLLRSDNPNSRQEDGSVEFGADCSTCRHAQDCHASSLDGCDIWEHHLAHLEKIP